MKIAVDIASADNPLEELVPGCVQALRAVDDLQLIAVGDGTRIEKSLKKLAYDKSRISIEHTVDVIGMDEAPATAIKEKKNASVMIANRLVAEKKADGCWSPGNTGATLAAALMEQRRLKGVHRPAILVPFPVVTRDTICASLDLGANADCTTDYLVQFAIMGEAYMRHVRGVEKPRIGLLNIGEEEGKGSLFYKETYEKLKALPFNFIGNIEPNMMCFDHADVVVADGFTGNIMLKAVEGTGKAILHIIKTSAKKSPLSMLGALLMGDAFKQVKRALSPESYGGEPLIGINGCSLIGHGHSSPLSVTNAVRTAVGFVRSRVNEHIVENLERYGYAKGMK